MTVVQAKRPLVPGADSAPFMDNPSRQIAAGMGTVIVHDIGPAFVEKHGQLKVPPLNIFTAPLF